MLYTIPNTINHPSIHKTTIKFKRQTLDGKSHYPNANKILSQYEHCALANIDSKHESYQFFRKTVFTELVLLSLTYSTEVVLFLLNQ